MVGRQRSRFLKLNFQELKLRRLLVLLILFAYCLPFQNCSKFGFVNEFEAKQKTEGDVYDGKLTFVHLQPGFNCELKIAPKVILRRDLDRRWTMTVNEPERCAAIDNQPVTDVIYTETSAFLTYQGLKFYRDRAAPEQPSSLALYPIGFRADPAANPNFPDIAIGDGVCADSTGRCSLKAAFDEMNSDINRSAMIFVPAGNYLLTSPLMANLRGVALIQGEGAASTVIDGGGTTALLVSAGFVTMAVSTTVISQLQLANGRTTNTLYGSAVTVNNSVRLDRCLITANKDGAPAVNGTTRARSVLIEDSRFINNEQSAIDVDFADNFVIDRTEISGSGWYGVRIKGAQTNLNIIRNSTIAGNLIGILLREVTTSFAIENTTITNNLNYGLMISNPGPGINQWQPYDFSLSHSTVSNNAVNSGANIQLDMPLTESRIFSIQNSIVASAFGGRPNCEMTSANANFSIISQGMMADDNSCLSSVILASPLLGPLADNGGPTPTRMPLTGSPAIDSGLNAICLASDQRGQARPIGKVLSTPTCDIGAVEVQ